MANHLSTRKTVRKSSKQSIVNKSRRVRVRTYIKRVTHSIDLNSTDKLAASKQLVSMQSEIMRAVSKGVIKKNTASRKISRLSKKVKLKLINNNVNSLLP